MLGPNEFLTADVMTLLPLSTRGANIHSMDSVHHEPTFTPVGALKRVASRHDESYIKVCLHKSQHTGAPKVSWYAQRRNT